MKKVKIFALLMCCFLLVSHMCGCAEENKPENKPKNTEYVVLEVGIGDSVDGGKHTSEVPIWDNSKTTSHSDSTAPANVTVNFDGKNYTGEYVRSVTRVPNLFTSHRYKCESENVFFEINGSTGELVDLIYARNIANESTVDEAYCREKADSIAKQYINLDEYKVEIASREEIRSNYACAFHYYREIDGYKTYDCINISVDGNGNVVTFELGDIGSFSGISSVKHEKDTAVKEIETKLAKIYTEENKLKDYKVNSVLLLKTDDNKSGFLYTINTEFEPKKSDTDDAYYLTGSLIQFLVCEK
ncbi:MAG: hypothetical protein IKM46_05615 [Clostridia bacterium]|nr:hypothetical protein [Clostridia bacterium]